MKAQHWVMFLTAFLAVAFSTFSVKSLSSDSSPLNVIKADIELLEATTLAAIEPGNLRNKLINRLNAAENRVEQAIDHLENGKNKKARKDLRKAKRKLRNYRKKLRKKMRKGKLSPAIAQPLVIDATAIIRTIKAYLRGTLGDNEPPVADAGFDQTVAPGAVVTLDGTGSSDPDGDAITYQWQVIGPDGADVPLSDPNAVSPTFTVELAGTYTAELTVSDGKKSSAPDQVLISTTNTAPVADAGPDQSAPVGTVIILDGSASSDADGDTLNFSWTLSGLPADSAAVLDDPSSVSPQLVLDKDGDYEAELIVNDGTLDSVPGTVTISTENSAPVANAGPDQAIFVGESIALDGSGSSDIDGDPLYFEWAVISAPVGSVASLSDATAVQPSFTADFPGVYVIQLIVDDDDLASAADTVVLGTQNRPPVADAGADQLVALGGVVGLDGSASSDPDGDAINYAWSITSAPTDSTASLADVQSATPSFTADLAGSYAIQLIVADTETQSSPDTVVVTTENTRPVAHAGSDQTAFVGDMIDFDGTASADADGDPINYQWSLTNAPPESSAALQNDTAAISSLTIDRKGEYVGQLIVDDGELVSDPDSAVVTVGNRAPSVSIDPIDGVFFVGDLVPITASITEPDGDSVSLSWALIGAPPGSASFISPTGANSASLAPNIAGTYLAEVTVDDGEAQASASTAIHVRPPNLAPVADAGLDQAVALGATVMLDGSRSRDPDGDPLSYEWTLANRPIGSVAALNNPASVNPSFVADVNGAYEVSLRVFDGYAYSPESIVSVTIDNAAPVFDFVPDQEILIGQEITVQLQANDPEGAAVQYTVTPLPLPSGASLDIDTGRFVFRPSSGDLGSFELTFSASDGQSLVSQQVQFIVLPPPVATPTSFSARILDANAAEQGVELPVVGAIVSFLGTGVSAASDATGQILLSGLPAGIQVLDIAVDGAQPAPDGAPYAGFREQYNLRPNTDNLVERPFFLPRLGAESLTTVDPNTTTVVTNDTLGVSLEVPPNTAKWINGEDFTGQLSISLVPRGLAPAPLPELLDPALLITIQPVGVTFATPVPITFPNTDGLSAGSEVDIWSLDPETGQFVVVGTGQVTVDGQSIETISGGIRAADWHAPLPPSPDPEEPPPDEPKPDPDPCNSSSSSGSTVDSIDGCLTTSVDLPSFYTVGQDRAVSLVYKSGHASPVVRIPFNARISVRAAVPPTVSYRMSMGGIDQSTETFIDTSSFNESIDESFRAVAQFGARFLSTGYYPYTIRTTSNYFGSRVSSEIQGSAPVVNLSESPFGAGWGFPDLSALDVNDDGSILIANGAGGTSHFVRTRPILIESFDTQRSSVIASRNLSFVAGEVYADARAALLNTSNFGTNGVETRAVRFRSGIPTITQEALTGVDVFVLNQLDPSQGLTGEEAAYLDAFVADGGALLEFRNLPSARPNLLGTLAGSSTGDGQAVLTPLGLDSPLVNGPFGQVFSPVRTGFAFAYAQTGLSDVLANNSSGPTILARPAGTEGEGAAILIGDEEVFASGFDTGGANHFLKQNNRTLFLNSMAFLSQAPGYLTMAPGVGEEFFSTSGDFSSLTRLESGAYIRRLPNGTVENYSSAGLLTERIDRNSNTTVYSYNSQQLLESVTEPTGLATHFAYNAGRLRSITDPSGRVTRFEHDAQGNLIAVTLPDNSIRRYRYDERHLMVSETDGNGNSVIRTYNAAGQLVKTVLPDGAIRHASSSLGVGFVDPDAGLGTAQAPAPVVRPTDASAGFTDGEGRTTQFEVNGFGDATAVVDPTGLVSVFDYDVEGNLIRSVRSNGEERQYTYDDHGNPLLISEVTFGGQLGLTYDSHSLITTRTDSFGNVTTTDRDASGNATAIRSAEGRLRTMQYNVRGQLTSIVDEFGAQRTHSYNSLGRLQSITEGLGAEQRTTLMSYTPEGYLAHVIDAEGRQLAFTYDQMGRIVEQELPDGRKVTTRYDANGNLIGLSPPEKPEHTFEYTPMDLESVYAPPAINLPEHNTQSSYNLAEQIERVDRADGQTITYAYDSGGRLSSVVGPDGVFGFEFDDGGGQVTQMTDPYGGQIDQTYQGSVPVDTTWSGPVSGGVQSTYDAERRLVTQSINGGHTASYIYDGDGLLTKAGQMTLDRGAQSGLLVGTSLGQVSTQMVRNAFAELASDTASINGNPVYEVTYTRDRLGRVIEKAEVVNGQALTTTYGYDLAGRLEQVTINGALTEQYTYDANGNRLSRTTDGGVESGQYNPQDRLLNYGDYAYTYNAHGDLESKTYLPSGDLYNYSFDVFGNLNEVSLPEGTIVGYHTDARHRRVARSVDGQITNRWLYQDQINPLAALDASGNVIARYVYAEKNNVPAYLVRIDPATNTETVYRIVSDSLGSPRLIIDSATGQVTQRLDYDAWGNITLDTNPGFQPFGFAGGLYDPLTGLTRFGARDYDPTIGRWMGTDPIRFAGDGTNLTVYVDNDPVNYADRLGLGRERLPLTPLQVLIETLTHVSPVGEGSDRPQDFTPGEIDGRQYTQHGFEQMYERGFTPSVIENTIQHGERFPGREEGTYQYYDAVNDVTVVINENGDVITVRRGPPRGPGCK